MVYRKIIQSPWILPLIAGLIFQGCNRAANAPSSVATPSPSAAAATSDSAHAIEMEIVAPQPIAGTVVAPGKILVPEDRTPNIGPVHEGRLVHLYAGQGSIVRKGQKLAELESADIDQAEGDYLKALADYENATRTSAAEVKFAQANYVRTNMLYEKAITAGKNLQQAEHDL